MTVRVTESGTPQLSDSRSFTISVVPPPGISSCTLSNGAFNLAWSAYPGKTYRVQYKTNLNDAAWVILGPDVVAAGYAVSATDTNFPTDQRFYRIVQTD